VRADLIDYGYLSSERHSLSARAIAIPPRRVGELLVRHLHPEISVFEEGNPEQPFISPFRFWRVAGGRGIILHTFFGLPVLMDYSALERHDSACLDQDAFEIAYLGHNFSKCDRVHIVKDSDEFGILSITPAPTRAIKRATDSNHQTGKKARLLQTRSIRESMAFYARRNRDVVKRNLFRVPIRWHGGDLDHTWQTEEQKVSDVMNRGVGDYPVGATVYFPRISLTPGRLAADIHFAYIFSPAIVRLSISTFPLIAKAMFGDRSSMEHLKHRMSKLRTTIFKRLAS
jgi:hypothetical protein